MTRLLKTNVVAEQWMCWEKTILSFFQGKRHIFFAVSFRQELLVLGGIVVCSFSVIAPLLERKEESRHVELMRWL